MSNKFNYFNFIPGFFDVLAERFNNVTLDQILATCLKMGFLNSKQAVCDL